MRNASAVISGSNAMEEFSQDDQFHIHNCMVQVNANHKRHAGWYADYDKALLKK